MHSSLTRRVTMQSMLLEKPSVPKVSVFTLGLWSAINCSGIRQNSLTSCDRNSGESHYIIKAIAQTALTSATQSLVTRCVSEEFLDFMR